MKAFTPSYNIVNAQSLQDAVELISREQEHWLPLAGGTDLMVQFESGNLPEGNYVSLWGLKDLKGITEDEEFVTIGALTTYGQLRKNKIIQKYFPMLIDAAKVVGSIAIQNRATIGGNIVNASPAADGPPAFLCYDAQIELSSMQGTRVVEYADFHKDYKKMEIKRDEILTRIKFPKVSSVGESLYRKVGTRAAQSISKICFCSRAVMDKKVISEIRIALASVAPIPFRAIETEKVLRGATLSAPVITKAIETLASEIKPIDDIRSTGAYRLKVSQNILEHFLKGLIN